MGIRSYSDSELAARLHDPGIRRLGIVIGLPLIDGVFITLVLAGILDAVAGVILTGLIIFGGTAAAAVVLADLEDESITHLIGLGVIGAIIIPVAGIQAMIAPTLSTWLDVALLERFAVIVLLIIAIKMMGLPFARYMPRSGVVVALALVVSLDISNGSWVAADLGLFVNGAVAAAIGILAVGSMILAGNRIRNLLDTDRIRMVGGASVAALAISLVLNWPLWVALGVLVIGTILALNRSPVEFFPGDVPDMAS